MKIEKFKYEVVDKPSNYGGLGVSCSLGMFDTEEEAKAEIKYFVENQRKKFKNSKAEESDFIIKKRLLK